MFASLDFWNIFFQNTATKSTKQLGHTSKDKAFVHSGQAAAGPLLGQGRCQLVSRRGTAVRVQTILVQTVHIWYRRIHRGLACAAEREERGESEAAQACYTLGISVQFENNPVKRMKRILCAAEKEERGKREAAGGVKKDYDAAIKTLLTVKKSLSGRFACVHQPARLKSKTVNFFL